MSFVQNCYFEGCTLRMTAGTQDEVDKMLTLDIQLVHLNTMLEERQLALQRIQAKYAEDNVKRYSQLAATGLTNAEVLSLGGHSGTIKVSNEDEKVEFSDWAKKQNYESWKIEFDYYKNTTLGIYTVFTMKCEFLTIHFIASTTYSLTLFMAHVFTT